MRLRSIVEHAKRLTPNWFGWPGILKTAGNSRLFNWEESTHGDEHPIFEMGRTCERDVCGSPLGHISQVNCRFLPSRPEFHSSHEASHLSLVHVTDTKLHTRQVSQGQEGALPEEEQKSLILVEELAMFAYHFVRLKYPIFESKAKNCEKGPPFLAYIRKDSQQPGRMNIWNIDRRCSLSKIQQRGI